MDPVAIAPAAVRVTFAPGETLPLVDVSPAALIGPETTIPPRAPMPIPPGWPAERSTPRPALESMPPEMRTSPPLIATAPPLPPSTTPAPGTSWPQLATVPRTLTSPPDEASSMTPPLARRLGSAPVAVSLPALQASPPISTPAPPCTMTLLPGACSVCVTTSPGESIEMLPELAAVPAVSTPPPSETRAARMEREPPGRLVPISPRRSIAGEIATPPDAVMESERPAVQFWPAVPMSQHVCSAASGPMNTSFAVIDVLAARRTTPSR